MATRMFDEQDDRIRAIKTSLTKTREKRSEQRTPEQRAAELHQLEMDLGLAVIHRPPARLDLRFSPIFCFQACLPHSPVRLADVDSQGRWIRRNGDFTLRIQSIDGPANIPYGKYSRLFLLWLTNEANRSSTSISQSGELSYQGSYRKFCSELRVDPACGVNGPGRRLIEQINRVINTSFEIEYVQKRAGKIERQRRHFYITSELHQSWDANRGPKDWMHVAKGGFKLSADFVEEIRKHKFPVDDRVMEEIMAGRSPFRIDLYHWLAYRNHELCRSKREFTSVISWDDLRGQFGGVYKNVDDFRASFRTELDVVKRLWPDLQYSAAAQGFILKRSREPVPGKAEARFA